MKPFSPSFALLPVAVALAAGVSSCSASAAPLPLSVLTMGVHTVAKSCQTTLATNCFNNSQYALDSDSASSVGAFSAMSVSSSITGTESATGDAFPASASASTTLGAGNDFTAHLVTDRPSVAAPYTGTYQTGADTTFSFTTLAAGTMLISYRVLYERPSNDSTLGAGFSYSSSAGSDGESALPTGAFSGSSNGSWSVSLLANTTYFVTLAADNSRSFSVNATPSGAYGSDMLDATYQVSFLAAVPEPQHGALFAAGLALLGARRAFTTRRRAR